MIPYEESVCSILRAQYRVGDFFMKQVAFPDFHRKKETIFVAKYLFTQISGEAKLQKISVLVYFWYVWMLFLSLLLIFPVLWNCLQLWVLADIFGFSLLWKEKFSLIHHLPKNSGHSSVPSFGWLWEVLQLQQPPRVLPCLNLFLPFLRNMSDRNSVSCFLTAFFFIIM